MIELNIPREGKYKQLGECYMQKDSCEAYFFINNLLSILKNSLDGIIWDGRTSTREEIPIFDNDSIINCVEIDGLIEIYIKINHQKERIAIIIEAKENKNSKKNSITKYQLLKETLAYANQCTILKKEISKIFSYIIYGKQKEFRLVYITTFYSHFINVYDILDEKLYILPIYKVKEVLKEKEIYPKLKELLKNNEKEKNDENYNKI